MENTHTEGCHVCSQAKLSCFPLFNFQDVVPATPESWSSKMAKLSELGTSAPFVLPLCSLFPLHFCLCSKSPMQFDRALPQGIVPPDDIRRRIRLTRGMLERDILGASLGQRVEMIQDPSWTSTVCFCLAGMRP